MSTPLVTNAANQRQVKEAGAKKHELERQEIEDILFILGSLQGRRFFWRYLCECGVFKSSFTGSSETYFLEGQRNVGLRLLADLNRANPKAYVLMIEENERTNN